MEHRLLKSKRVLNGFTQEQIANVIGINTKSYNLKENGKNRFSLEEVVRVSETLELTLEEVNDIFLQMKLPKGNKKRGRIR
ncbi:XRE family transcriptional regulator [Romboutsia ilealis]|uniref:Helix-turn-helix transcriptional regulator n=1 Tax=Romboutsia faecis TaxID=2764597 RepID=A0ABR7JNL9_9FIRM|nr:helix-turn-helix transcriptional regulator [Romboutsia faecis]MBC5996508.1 helix-turn-helix transcriptional regulator [Romboutsia faecis]MRN24034.1 XRE family transcriptional regulator [Romboutsia ilealis]